MFFKFTVVLFYTVHICSSLTDRFCCFFCRFWFLKTETLLCIGSESFTVQHPCRFCMVKRSDIQQREVRSGAFECRTIQDHDRFWQSSTACQAKTWIQNSSENLTNTLLASLRFSRPRGDVLARNFRIICNKSHQRVQMLLRSEQQSSVAFLSFLEMRTQTFSRHALTAMTQACLTSPLESWPSFLRTNRSPLTHCTYSLQVPQSFWRAQLQWMTLKIFHMPCACSLDWLTPWIWSTLNNWSTPSTSFKGCFSHLDINP